MKKVGPNLYRTPSGRYYLLVKRAGKQFRRSLKTKDAKLAKRRLLCLEFSGTAEGPLFVFCSPLKGDWTLSGNGIKCSIICG
jgi:hypothetical protein